MNKKTLIILSFSLVIGGILIWQYPGILGRVGISKTNDLIKIEKCPLDKEILPEVFGKYLSDTWEYSGGVMEEYVGYNATGNRMTIYYDQETGELRGFTNSLPVATKIILSLKQAHQIAEEIACQFPFFNDPNLQLKEAILVDHGPGTERYYSFHWLAEDFETGAVLLREIHISIHPESGEIIYLLTEDGGEVTVSTVPTLTVEDARNLTFSKAKNILQELRVKEEILYVSKAYNGQRLVWMVVFEEVGEWAREIYIDVDAHTGEILEVGY